MIVLALTWRPRGEAARFVRLHSHLMQLYDAITIAASPDTTSEEVSAVSALPGVDLHIRDVWKAGRHEAVRRALLAGADFVHYADTDRLLRWVERLPEELNHAVEQIASADCLVPGRTPAAFATHPRALQDTERITNGVFSQILGQTVDFSAGSKGFSRACAEFILRNSPPEYPIGTDSEWIVLAWRGGFEVRPAFFDGLDWESADQFQAEAADPERQSRLAAEYDRDPAHWQTRLRIAQEIIDAGFEALRRPLIT
ncbi:MAG: hypothetical protein IPK19_42435 [Chloroflexi bacterium]|nr:hypothetical protein [Chloroflexota bacterium]